MRYEQGEKLWWFNDESKIMLERGYFLEGEDIHKAIDRITTSAANKLNNMELKPIFKEIIEKGWMSLSSPIWANMGTERGLPISCFGVYIDDSMESITDKLGEVIMQTKFGGGTSGYFGSLRGRGEEITNNGKSNGSIAFMQLFDSAMNVVSQGGVRRGAFAGYLDIDHPDVMEFLQIKDIGNLIQNLFFGVTVSDEWMESMIEGDTEKRQIWAKVLQSRQDKGLPYILFSDNINNNKPQVYKDKEMKIYASNLCSEIALPSSNDESFVCCLSSMNLELYDEWKDTDAVKYAIYFLDAVMQEFIDKTEGNKYMEATHNFAKRHRALGLGVLGWHSLLQKNMIPFEGLESKQLTYEISENIQKRAIEASKELADIYGEPELMKGYGMRNTTLTAIAPTTSSSSILGQSSAGIEPFSSNYYKVGLAKGNFIRKNKYLKELLQQKNMDTDEIWSKIMFDNGSVMNLDFLSEHEKSVFKTFKEISQLEIIQQNSIRQKFIDQSISLNINIPPTVAVKDVNKLIIEAWKLGIKSLYYQRSQSVAKENLNTNSIIDCVSCEA